MVSELGWNATMQPIKIGLHEGAVHHHVCQTECTQELINCPILSGFEHFSISKASSRCKDQPLSQPI